MSVDNVADIDPIDQYTASASQTVFPYTFPIFEDANLVVYDNDTLMTLTTDYTVDGETEDTGGNVTFVTGRTAGHTITIYRDVAIQRITDFQQNGTRTAAAMNDELDRMTMYMQQLERNIGRAVRQSLRNPQDSSELELDSSYADRYLYVNTDGELEPAAAIDTTTLTQSIIGELLYPQTLAESAALVTPVDYAYQECHVNRYGNNTTPGTTNMDAAFTAVMLVLSQKDGGILITNPKERYKTTQAVTFPVACQRITWHGNNAEIVCSHTGHGIVNVSTNENYGGHVIYDLIVTGPDSLGYDAARTSTGAAICMTRNATTNVNAAYNCAYYNVTGRGFKYGEAMQSNIGIDHYHCYFIFNDYGVWIDGGAVNGNNWFGGHIRYNQKAGVYSTGRTGGSLTNATQNRFYGTLIESNVPNTGTSGGTPPTDSTGIYLSNSYEFHFVECYSENHACAIYLTGASKANKFKMHLSPGLGRIDQIILDGAGIYENEFDLHCDSASLTEVSVVSNSADQLYNEFRGSGINFVSGSVSANLDYSNVKPGLNFVNSVGYGHIRLPTQGYQPNVSEGTAPGQVDGIATSSATLNARGFGEISLGNGITGNTTIDAITNVPVNSFFVLNMTQSTYTVRIDSAAFNSDLVGVDGMDIVMTTAGQTLVFYKNGLASLTLIGKNFEGAPLLVSELPAASAARRGARVCVSDANATTFMSTVAGGGANIVPVFCNGTNWVIG